MHHNGGEDHEGIYLDLNISQTYDESEPILFRESQVCGNAKERNSGLSDFRLFITHPSILSEAFSMILPEAWSVQS